jgi:hypothetical protein
MTTYKIIFNGSRLDVFNTQLEAEESVATRVAWYTKNDPKSLDACNFNNYSVIENVTIDYVDVTIYTCVHVTGSSSRGIKGSIKNRDENFILLKYVDKDILSQLSKLPNKKGSSFTNLKVKEVKVDEVPNDCVLVNASQSSFTVV